LAVVAALPVVLAGLLAEQARTGLFQRGGRGALGLVAPAGDPTFEAFGWDQVARELDRRGLLGRPDTFLFTGHWYLSAQLAFAIRDETPVLCYSGHDARGFAYWSDPERWVGRDGILVALDDRSTEPACFDRWFARIEPIGRFPLVRSGAPVRQVRLFRCTRQVRAFPFDGRESPAPEPRLAAKEGMPGR
jgi:hypothetical protein